jgi:hypothetical protein
MAAASSVWVIARFHDTSSAERWVSHEDLKRTRYAALFAGIP